VVFRRGEEEYEALAQESLGETGLAVTSLRPQPRPSVSLPNNKCNSVNK
jgi:hypothetical protein